MVFHPFRARPYDGVRSKWTRSDDLIESWIHKNIPEKRNLIQILKQSSNKPVIFPLEYHRTSFLSLHGRTRCIIKGSLIPGLPAD